MTHGIFSVYTPDWQPMVDLVKPLWQEYADRHGYGLVCIETPPRFPEHYSFSKTSAVAETVRSYGGKGPEMFVIDLDMIPTSMELPLEALCPILNDVAMGKDINGWNSGAYFVRGTEKAQAWLDSIVALRGVTTSEQHAMWLINEAFKVAEVGGVNSIPYDAYEGFNFQKKDHYSQWEPGHFTCHLPGMTMEDRILMLQTYIPKIVR